MSISSEIDAAKAEMQALRDKFQADFTDIENKTKALEAELAQLPGELIGKTEAELAVMWAHIQNFFRGSVPPVQ